MRTDERIPVGLAAQLSRSRVLGLAAVLMTGGVLLAQATQAAAVPATPTTPGKPSTSSSALHPSSTTPVRHPRATAPQPPVDNGPPCTTNADKLYPVVCLPAGSGEDRTGQVTAGEDIEFDAQIVNNGMARSNADIVITLPEGLGLETDEDDPVYRYADNWYDDDNEGDASGLTCTVGTSTITCLVGALKVNANVLIGIDLEAAKDAPAGDVLAFQVALQPAGDDTYDPTSVTASLRIVEPAHLVVSLTPATLTTVVGHGATITATVHNQGPGTAADTMALAVAVDERNPKGTHFVITNGVDATQGGQTVGVVVVGKTPAVRARLQQRALTRAAAAGVRRHTLPSLRFWPLGTLASGATVTVPIKVRAVSPGTDTLLFTADTDSGDPACDSGQDGDSGGSGTDAPSATPPARAASTTTAPGECQDGIEIHLTAVRPAAATASSSAAPLADTGTHGLDLQLGIAVWAVVLGALLGWLGRRRVVAGRHQH